jgi:serine protease Do
MNVVKKGLSALVISGVAVGSYFGGSALVRDVRYAQAEDQVQASREDLKKVDDIYGVYRAVGRAMEPSVVSIEVHKTVKGAHNGMNFDDDLLRRFFQQGPDGAAPNLPPNLPRNPHRQMPNNPDNNDDNNNNNDDQSDSMEQVAGGSGVIMEAADGKGYILTNNHVAGGAESMTVTLSDGRKIKQAKVLGTDPKSDLAVVEIEADKLIPASWGDSDKLDKGDVIFAFGSPFGYVGSMTHGIVSALNRQNIGILGRRDFAYENFIQVDAPINPGNSGGPLVNLHGEVVGINTAIATETGAFNGIGFAIPSNMAKPVYQQLKESGKVVRGFIGVQIESVGDDVDLAKSFGFDKETGVLVQQTFADTPATGKLKRGDIVTAIGGKPVKDSNQLRTAVANTKPGTDLAFTVFRKGKTQDVTIKIGEQPDELARAGASHSSNENGGNDNGTAETSAKALGLRLMTPNDELIQRFGLDADTTQGALVTGVDRHSPAAQAGIQPGDIITQVGDKDVTTAGEARDAMAKQDLAKGIRLSITNRQGSRFVLLRQDAK